MGGGMSNWPAPFFRLPSSPKAGPNPKMVPLLRCWWLSLLLGFVQIGIGQPGPTISGIPPAADEAVDDKRPEQHQRHAFSVLEPELAERIFSREGAKNPLSRTTTMPLKTDRLDSGHTGGANGGQKGEKSAPSKRMPRAIQSEYEALNDDFISEYDALNLDFNLDEEPAGKKAKELEVPAREFAFQDGGSQQKVDEQFPPKEWWGEEEEAEETATTMNSRPTPKPVLKASKLLTMRSRKEPKKDLPMPEDDQGEEEAVDLPKLGDNNGTKKRSGRARRSTVIPPAARVEGVARLGGWQLDGPLTAGAVDPEQLRVLPRLVPSYPPPSSTSTATTKATIATTTRTTASPVEATTKVATKVQRVLAQFVQKSLPPQRKVWPKKIHEQPQEFLRDLPSGLDEHGGLLDGTKATAPRQPQQQHQQHLADQDIQQQQQQQLFQFQKQRPFPAGQQQLNLGQTGQNVQQRPVSGSPQGQQSPPSPNHSQDSPAGRLLPTGFVHIATLEAPPQQLGGNQILIGGKRFWVERTVPLSQFLAGEGEIKLRAAATEQQKTAANGQKTPAEELPTLLDMPRLSEASPPPSSSEAAVEERSQTGPKFADEEQPKLRANAQRRVANSARVYSLADNDVPLWAPGQQQQQQQQFGGFALTNNQQQRRLSSSPKSDLLALNLGSALSQIFGNFTIEHDVQPVERQRGPADGQQQEQIQLAGAAVHRTVGGMEEANSEPHRITRFFDRPQRRLHGN